MGEKEKGRKEIKSPFLPSSFSPNISSTRLPWTEGPCSVIHRPQIALPNPALAQQRDRRRPPLPVRAIEPALHDG
jgi:hypothetical protein